MDVRTFERVVQDELKRLPEQFRERLRDVEIVIELGEREDGDELTGLYEGTPLTEKSLDDNGTLPDRITLYKREIEAECREEGIDLREHIAHVLRHEIAHHFGISDERLDDLGLY